MTDNNQDASANRAVRKFKRSLNHFIAGIVAAPLSIALVSLVHTYSPTFALSRDYTITDMDLRMGLLVGGLFAFIAILASLDFGKTGLDPTVGLSGRKRFCFVIINGVFGFLCGYALVGFALVVASACAEAWAYIILPYLVPALTWLIASPLSLATALAFLGGISLLFGKGCLRHAYVAEEDVQQVLRKHREARIEARRRQYQNDTTASANSAGSDLKGVARQADKDTASE